MEEVKVVNDAKINEQELEDLGFTKVANDLKKAKEFERKCTIAYEHFARRVSREQINDFNKKLMDSTMKEYNYQRIYDKLIFTDISDYPKIPPVSVLSALRDAQKLDVFDYFEVGHIQSCTEKKDPILFGCINGCPDRFFIGQWDNDVKIEDLLSAEEVNVKIDGIQI